MFARTDLALERREMAGECDVDGIVSNETRFGNTKVTSISIKNAYGAKMLQKPIGEYITLEVPPFSDDSGLFDGRIDVLKNEIRKMLPDEGTVLVAGLGNRAITPDSLGPRVAKLIFSTRHIEGEIARSAGLGSLRSVVSCETGVLGETGMESAEVIEGIVKTVKPSAVIAVDALASRNLSRLGCTVQLSDTGINPGSGVGNTRHAISEKTLGVPVIAVGVPTVVDASTLVCDLVSNVDENEKQKIIKSLEPRGERMIVTPREIDILTERAARFVAMGINCALNPELDPQDILSLVTE